MTHPRGTLDADMLVMESASIKLSQGVYSVVAEILLVSSVTGRTLASSTITAWPDQVAVGKAAGDFIEALEEASAGLLFGASSGPKSAKTTTGSGAPEGKVSGLSEHLGLGEENDDVPQG